MRLARPICSSARPNLAGAEGSDRRLPSVTHKAAKNGARIMIRIGLIDWKIDAGTPERSTKRSVNRFIDPPACSNRPQNNGLRLIRNRIAHKRAGGRSLRGDDS